MPNNEYFKVLLGNYFNMEMNYDLHTSVELVWKLLLQNTAC